MGQIFCRETNKVEDAHLLGLVWTQTLLRQTRLTKLGLTQIFEQKIGRSSPGWRVVLSLATCDPSHPQCFRKVRELRLRVTERLIGLFEKVKEK